MITTTRTAPADTRNTTIRVAVREIREATYRALIAAGASAGEAATAAALALHTEMHCGAGITAVLHELPRVPRGRIPLGRDRKHRDRLIDPAGRGPLLRLPAATDLAVATGQPLFLTEMAWNPVIPAALHRTCTEQGVVLAAAEITHTGAIGGVAIGYPDGSADRAPGPPAATALLNSIGHHQALDVSMTAGVLLIPGSHGPRTGRQSAADLHRRTAAAFAGGVQVDAAGWAALYAAAGLFLVPEQ